MRVMNTWQAWAVLLLLMLVLINQFEQTRWIAEAVGTFLVANGVLLIAGIASIPDVSVVPTWF